MQTYRSRVFHRFVHVKITLEHRFHQIVVLGMVAQADRRQLQWITRQNDLATIWIDACDRNHCFTFTALSSLVDENMREIFIAEFAATTNKKQ